MLMKGQRFRLAGHSWRVVYVNASRAHCVCTETQAVVIKGRTFQAHVSRSLDISPDSAIDVLEEFTKGTACAPMERRI